MFQVCWMYNNKMESYIVCFFLWILSDSSVKSRLLLHRIVFMSSVFHCSEVARISKCSLFPQHRSGWFKDLTWRAASLSWMWKAPFRLCESVTCQKWKREKKALLYFWSFKSRKKAFSFADWFPTYLKEDRSVGCYGFDGLLLWHYYLLTLIFIPTM